jgi:hypothetical protein
MSRNRRIPSAIPVVPTYKEGQDWIEAFLHEMGNVIHESDHPMADAACPMCGAQSLVHQFLPALQMLQRRDVHYRCPACKRLLGFVDTTVQACSERQWAREDHEEEEARAMMNPHAGRHRKTTV